MKGQRGREKGKKKWNEIKKSFIIIYLGILSMTVVKIFEMAQKICSITIPCLPRELFRRSFELERYHLHVLPCTANVTANKLVGAYVALVRVRAS